VDANLTRQQPALFASDTRLLRIVVVSRTRFLREGVVQNLESDQSISVVGQCADLAELAALSLALPPDLVLMDAALLDGPVATARTRRHAQNSRIIAFAMQDREVDLSSWAQAGVVGYIPNTASWADLARLIKDIANGEQPCSGRVAAGPLRWIAVVTPSLHNDCDIAPQAPALTAREQQAAELIGTGLSDKEIARSLNISLATTKSHVHSLLGKLNAQRRSQVIVRLRQYESG
jgi:DNA-binding NarL/FixJ family response regulator